MEKLVLHLLANRDLLQLYPITSHYKLNAFVGKNFEEQYGKTFISIELSYEVRKNIKDKYRYKFSLTQSKIDQDIYKEYVESIFHSFANSLEVYDEMIENLERLHK